MTKRTLRLAFGVCLAACLAMGMTACSTEPAEPADPAEDTIAEPYIMTNEEMMEYLENVDVDAVLEKNLPRNVVKEVGNVYYTTEAYLVGDIAYSMQAKYYDSEGEFFLVGNISGAQNYNFASIGGAFYAKYGEELRFIASPAVHAVENATSYLLGAEDDYEIVYRSIEDGFLVLVGESVDDNVRRVSRQYYDMDTLLMQGKTVEFFNMDGTMRFKSHAEVSYDTDTFMPSEVYDSTRDESADLCTVTVVDIAADGTETVSSYKVLRGSNMMAVDLLGEYVAYSDEACTQEMTETIALENDVTVYFKAV